MPAELPKCDCGKGYVVPGEDNCAQCLGQTLYLANNDMSMTTQNPVFDPKVDRPVRRRNSFGYRRPPPFPFGAGPD